MNPVKLAVNILQKVIFKPKNRIRLFVHFDKRSYIKGIILNQVKTLQVHLSNMKGESFSERCQDYNLYNDSFYIALDKLLAFVNKSSHSLFIPKKQVTENH